MEDSQKFELLKELNKERKNIKTDSYSMSIGEIINLYNEGDLNLKPAFQRLFRWDIEHKTKFIESIILGIPIPEIFVAQQANGKWDIVDGVQRISTILQLTGNLKKYNFKTGKIDVDDKLVLQGTKYLPSLEGFSWSEIPIEVKTILKRAKMGINIILTENSIEAQYELFQRLNTGGLHLEKQEIRNCLLIMLDENFFEKIDELKNYHNFISCLPITKEKKDVEYHMELILRYFIGKMNIVNFENYKASDSIMPEFIDKETINFFKNEKFNIDVEIEIFKHIFDFLHGTLKEDIFKKYNPIKERFEGPFSLSSFEAIMPGLADNIMRVSANYNKKQFIELIKNMYTQDKYKKAAGRGVKPITRFKELIDFSKEYFSNDQGRI